MLHHARGSETSHCERSRIMRLDVALVEQGLCQSRSQASDWIKRGFIEVSGKIIYKPSYDVLVDHVITLKKEEVFVGRGGDKLLSALQTFKYDVMGKSAIDIGASTGGFTDVLLKKGVTHITTYDVGHDQMVPILKEDPRVTCFEGENVIHHELPIVDVITIDVSFTSILPIIDHIKTNQADVLALIKPQFEQTPPFKDVLKDVKTISRILQKVLTHMKDQGYFINGLIKSTVLGKKGNQEYFVLLKKNPHSKSLDAWLKEAI
jgi:23S rRNA (cytidine1920-2'-O)/16S rRNA (cytidine1409-2'-O)-methyltransferase